MSIREIAKQFRIGPASVSRWINQIDPKASTTRQRKIDKPELIKYVEQYPDAYQQERAERFGVFIKPFGKLFKRWDEPIKKLYVIRKPTKVPGKHFKKNNSIKNNVNLLFLFIKVVFHTMPRGLTAIPQKGNAFK